MSDKRMDLCFECQLVSRYNACAGCYNNLKARVRELERGLYFDDLDSETNRSESNRLRARVRELEGELSLRTYRPWVRDMAEERDRYREALEEIANECEYLQESNEIQKEIRIETIKLLATEALKEVKDE